MLLIDDILTFPIKGIFWIFKEIHNAAQQEQEGEADRITARLTELYMMLETGQITETEFDAQEKELLDRLEQLQESGNHLAADQPEAPRKKAIRTKRKAKAGGRKKRAKLDEVAASNP
ncbi:MAG: gas vesicle protein GvpG [Desulfobaccales bacterium]